MKKAIKPLVKAGRGRPRKHFYSTESAESGKALRLLKRVMKRVADCDATCQLLQDVVQSIKKEQGRPYRIVNTNAKRKIKRGGRVVTETVPVAVEGWNGLNNEGFDTEEQAKASYRDLKVLVVKLLQKASENPTDSTAIALLRDLTHHTPRYEIVGPPGQQRTKKHRDAKKAREEEEARNAQEYATRQFEDSDRQVLKARLAADGVGNRSRMSPQLTMLLPVVVERPSRQRVGLVVTASVVS